MAAAVISICCCQQYMYSCWCCWFAVLVNGNGRNDDGRSDNDVDYDNTSESYDDDNDDLTPD